jgi:hypothetical protein
VTSKDLTFNGADEIAYKGLELVALERQRPARWMCCWWARAWLVAALGGVGKIVAGIPVSVEPESGFDFVVVRMMHCGGCGAKLEEHER